jgi:hypothetical protein
MALTNSATYECTIGGAIPFSRRKALLTQAQKISDDLLHLKISQVRICHTFQGI